jgi:hypothetical protein
MPDKNPAGYVALNISGELAERIDSICYHEFGNRALCKKSVMILPGSLNKHV